jgi:hypothetical protein
MRIYRNNILRGRLSAKDNLEKRRCIIFPVTSPFRPSSIQISRCRIEPRLNICLSFCKKDCIGYHMEFDAQYLINKTQYLPPALPGPFPDHPFTSPPSPPFPFLHPSRHPTLLPTHPITLHPTPIKRPIILESKLSPIIRQPIIAPIPLPREFIILGAPAGSAESEHHFVHV